MMHRTHWDDWSISRATVAKGMQAGKHGDHTRAKRMDQIRARMMRRMGIFSLEHLQYRKR